MFQTEIYSLPPLPGNLLFYLKRHECLSILTCLIIGRPIIGTIIKSIHGIEEQCCIAALSHRCLNPDKGIAIVIASHSSGLYLKPESGVFIMKIHLKMFIYHIVNS